MLGMIAGNLAAGVVNAVQWHGLDGVVAAGAIPGAVNMPVDELRDRHAELPNAPLVVHCAVGQRGNTAARILAQLAFTVSNLDGGYLTRKRGTRVVATVPA